jgi:predicted ABC-type ATPase
MENLLDVFDDFRTQVPLLRLYLESSANLEGKAFALAQAAAEIQKKTGLEAADLLPRQLPHVIANLRTVEPVPENVVRALKLVVKYIDTWKFDTTGKVESPPSLGSSDAKGLRLTHAEMNIVHTLAYIYFPPKCHDYSLFAGITESLTRELELPTAKRPVAVITVGPPGSGKTYTLHSESGCLSYLQANHGGPLAKNYEEIDPDQWVTRLGKNDNNFRPLCNMLNLENLFFAINQGYNVIFEGTGKDVKNICGRVIARLRQAGYRIYFVIVLSSFDSCMKRIRKRSQETGRDVPEKVVRSLFESLQVAVPIYLKNQSQICDAVLLYENSDVGRELAPLVVSGGINAARALEIASRSLVLPQDAAA